MKNSLAPILMILILCTEPGGALTLNGRIEKIDTSGRIGITVSKSGNVSYVHPGSPADVAGLLRNDTIARVDGRRHAITAIEGQPGTHVILEICRGFNHFTIAIQRVDIDAIRP